ncbi:MAG: hypothetical protein ACK5OI_09915 [Curvibacter sp.]
MKLKDLWRKKKKKQWEPGGTTVVVFAGGMGTQIIQAAVYFSLRQAGERVRAALRYFDTEARMSQVGEKGRPTHWFWQLDQYGLTRESFEHANADELSRGYMLADGLEMGLLALPALADPRIQQHFVPRDLGALHMPPVASEQFLCIHVRRGDYVNVASHLVTDEEFLDLGRKFSGLVDHAVLLSDSPFEAGFKAQMDGIFRSVSYLDQLDPYSSHWLMRHARILVCSNSTYSLTAALLNPKALVVMPKRWFGPKDQAIEAPIQDLCRFQVMS